jgi:hypothetical protein
MDMATIKNAISNTLATGATYASSAGLKIKEGSMWLYRSIVWLVQASAALIISGLKTGWAFISSKAQLIWRSAVPLFHKAAELISTKAGALSISCIAVLGCAYYAFKTSDKEQQTRMAFLLIGTVIASVAAGILLSQAGLVPGLV